MTTLHDRLAELADDAPPGGPVPDLWDRGRRVHRRSQVGTVVIAAVMLVALGALGLLDWSRSQPAPSPAGGTPALPQKIWRPSPWLPGTDDAGQLGPLGAVQYAERGGWGGSSPGVVGVSAITGEYRFLDLPDASSEDVSLAPDGRHVAYWYTGETRRSPNSESGPIVGIAVFDTSTGEVLRHAVPSDHGLMVNVRGRPVWADSERLVFDYAIYRGGDGDDDMAQSSGTSGPGLLVWEPASGTEPSLLVPSVDGSVEAATGQGQILVSGGKKDLWLDLDDPARTVRFEAPDSLGFGDSAVDVSGSRMALIPGDRNPGRVAVVPLRQDGATPQEVPRSARTFQVRAWLDEDHIAVDRRTGPGWDRTSLYEVDVRTGKSTLVLHFPLRTYGTSIQLATDLLDDPTATRSEPPRPLDPRVVTGASIVVALAGFGAVLVWRRRVRA